LAVSWAQALIAASCWNSFGRAHKAYKLSPVMAAGVTDKLLSMEDLPA